MLKRNTRGGKRKIPINDTEEAQLNRILGQQKQQLIQLDLEQVKSPKQITQNPLQFKTFSLLFSKKKEKHIIFELKLFRLVI
jgi:hypothetical protein